MGRRAESDHLENRLRELRRATGLSQGDLAGRAGITRQAVSAIESGSYVPNTAVALRLSRALGCTVEELFRTGDISLKLPARPASTIGGWAGGSQRVQLARIGDVLVATPASDARGFSPADGVVEGVPSNDRQVDVELLVDQSVLDRTVVLLGCDPSLGLLAEHVRRHSRETRVLWRHAGSTAALRALRAGEAHIAGTHLWDPETGESNLPVIRRELDGMSVVVIALSQWQQGLMVAPGNPKGIQGVIDLARSDIAIVNRESGSGSRVLLDHHLAQVGVRPEWIAGYEQLRRSHIDIAMAVRDGLADAGPGILATARACGLDFIPLQEERYDLVVPATFMADRSVQVLLDTATGSAYRREIETLGGYDTSLAGTVIAEIG